jgi:hypothetical protein
LLHSLAYHPQTSGQTERVNQILEDMLRACALEFPQKWDDCLPLAEFSYNNSYQESIKMAPFEALYGRRCRTLLNWSEPGERNFFRPDMGKETEEKVQRIIHNLKKAQARQKCYADKRRIPLYFLVGDYVYLKVSPMKGASHFGVKGKLAPRYIGPFPILEQCGPVAYRLQLPETLSVVHNVFHVSQLKKCLRVPDRTIEVTDVALEPALTYSEHPIWVLDQKDRITRRKTLKFYKIQWNQHSEDEATWETQDFLEKNFPGFLASCNLYSMYNCCNKGMSPKPSMPCTKNKEIKICHVSFFITCPRTFNLGMRFFYGGKDVTPLVLLPLKLEHNIISIGISCVCYT